jgi:hypothetical protein
MWMRACAICKTVLFKVSLGREGAVPVWVGMGWLATNSAKVSQSNH